MKESRSQAMLKLEVDQADRELAMIKMKLETQEMIAKEKRDNKANREFAMMKLKLETQERIAKGERESDERIAAQNISFQLEIQKLKAHLKSGPRGPSSRNTLHTSLNNEY